MYAVSRACCSLARGCSLGGESQYYNYYVEDIWTIDTRVDTELHDSILQGGFLAITDLAS